MSFCENTKNGDLYVTVGIQLWKRNNGASPSWSLVGTAPLSAGWSSQSGLRGATFDAGTGMILVALEGYPFTVYQVNPSTGVFTSMYTQADLQGALGAPYVVNYAIGAYNGMEWVQYVSGGMTYWYVLMGLSIQVSNWSGAPTINGNVYQSVSGQDPWVATANYLVWDTYHNTWSLKTLGAVATYKMVAIRAIVVDSTYTNAYFAGFDCEEGMAPGNSAWSAKDTVANVTGN